MTPLDQYKIACDYPGIIDDAAVSPREAIETADKIIEDIESL